MFHAPDWYHNVSLGLSEVLGDIGVNEKLLLKIQRANLLQESIQTIGGRLEGKHFSVYKLGSQCEGTTTVGLKSDMDILTSLNDINVIQNWDEWSPCKANLMMICDESTPSGYCYLQPLRSDAQRRVTKEKKYYVKDKHGRVLMQNLIVDIFLDTGKQRHGPSVARIGSPHFDDQDIVYAIPLKSWPQSARRWLKHVHSRWPTAAMKQDVATSDCFVVGTGSCVSEDKDFQWRISTCLAERCLMFNLNITQIRCYILLKMILKTFINLQGQKHISSYMCKTVLLHCVETTGSHVWKESNILLCLKYCLSKLTVCVSCGNCPHFILPENNLMAGKITPENKNWLLIKMSKLIQHTAGSLFGIQIDALDQRLKMKLGILPDVDYNAIFGNKNTAICVVSAGRLLFNTALTISQNHETYLITIKNESLEKQILHLRQTIANLVKYHTEGTLFERKACRVLAPFFWTSLGSLIASYNIKQNSSVYPQALIWLCAGIYSDVSSGRLKLASVFYCTGDMERAASILRDTEKLYNANVVPRGTEEQYKKYAIQPVCRCYTPSLDPKPDFCVISFGCNEEGLRYLTAFCVRFLPSEINCIPKELQYELFRSTEDELLHREKDDAWMDLAAVDSILYFYFLQYKIYRNLQIIQDQRQALNNLLHFTINERNLGHRETAWNLLGQCMEQENRLNGALWCYSNSLNVRQTNNVARVHICRLLASIIALPRENN